jgi:uncharacterized protein (TIGR00255 family)
MIKSMTAFASGEAVIDSLTVNCELRSVNHRYSDISVKLPECIRIAELDIRSLISTALKRGKIECSLSYKKNDNTQHNIAIDEDAVRALLQVTAKIEEKMHSVQTFSALDVLNFPGIQQQPKNNKQVLLQEIIELVAATLKQMVLNREREGAQLALLIEQRCQTIQLLVNNAEQRLPIVLEQIKTKLKTRITEMLEEPDFDRLEQEMVFLAQKLDVAEELDRLDTHVKEVLHVLKKQEPVGRRLDFLMQEMNREANTLGSKSADKEITKITIDLKVLIEQMREQIQNIE